ncbi:serine/threonine-protein kinase, partial [Streptomyces sp. NPDC001868]|uniref:WD40 repeat domain-containing serine/threonine protein kinase n=1 Tax=Streptomyces sp. NPDC001868 TaxID=3154401 RepID=UPI00332A8131
MGDYWLAARLGSGGQGVVYEAYDAVGARVAVKVLHRDMAAGAKSGSRFAKEITAAQRVASFCTAKVLAADADAVPPYIVSEFVSGSDLGTVVWDHGPLSGDDLVRLATGVVTALAAIHQAGVVHRDLKPGNVLLGPDGPRVIDFGIARTPEMTLTETGVVMGTFGYIAPEILQGRRGAEAADVFAWGALVVFAGTGHEPFKGTHIGEVIHRTFAHEPDLAALPERLRTLVGQALARDPADRPAAADILLRLLGAGADSRQALRAGADAAADLHASETAPVPALGETAEAVYRALRPPAQAACRAMWLRLVAPGSTPDGSHDTVRTVDDSELLSGRSQDERTAVRQTVDAFVDAGLLVREATTVRPVNAAVLWAWPRLRGWVDRDREALRIHRKLGEAARAWDEHGRRPEDLERGTALRDALAWVATAAVWLRPNQLEAHFLQISQTADTRRARRIRRLNVFLVGTLVLTLVSAGVALWQRQTALTQREAAVKAQKQAVSRQLAAHSDALMDTNPDLASLLAVSAYRTSPTTEAMASLDAAADIPLIRRLSGHANGVYEVKYSPDGKTLATDGDEGTVWLWDPATGRHRSTLRVHDGSVNDVEFSPDGKTLATAGEDGTVRLWDPATGRARAVAVFDHGSPVFAVAFSPDGKTLATAGEDGTVRLWDPATGRARAVAV